MYTPNTTRLESVLRKTTYRQPSSPCLGPSQKSTYENLPRQCDPNEMEK